MAPPQEGKNRQVNIRLTASEYEQLLAIAKRDRLTVTDVVMRSVTEYMDRISAQICQGCRTANNPEANYCSNCGLPLNPDSLDEFRKMYEFFQKHPGYRCIANSKSDSDNEQ